MKRRTLLAGLAAPFLPEPKRYAEFALHFDWVTNQGKVLLDSPDPKENIERVRLAFMIFAGDVIAKYYPKGSDEYKKAVLAWEDK